MIHFIKVAGGTLNDETDPDLDPDPDPQIDLPARRCPTSSAWLTPLACAQSMADAAASQESIGTQSSTGGLVVTDGSDPGVMGKPDRGNVCDDDEYDRIGAEALEAVEHERRELSEPSSASTTRIRPAFSLVTSQAPLPPLGPVPPNVTPMPPNVTQYTQLTCVKTPPGVAALKDEVADRSAHIIQLEHTLELEQQKQLQTKNRIAARGRAEADRLMGLLKAQATELDEARARVKKLG